VSTIIIVSGIQLAANPRVVKEADTLSAAGYDVTVLGAGLDDSLSRRDEQLHSGKRWKYVSVLDSGDKLLLRRAEWLAARVRMRLWKEAGRLFDVASVNQVGYAASQLLSYCRSHHADLYILHHPQSMWVGVQLAADGKRIAADFEDWYSRDAPADRPPGASFEKLAGWERIVLERAAYTTTPSRAMSDAIAARYRCRAPAAIYNSFPFAERNELDGLRLDRRDSKRPSLIWFSQVIGPGRGLETIVDCLGELHVPLEVHIRGNGDPAYEAALQQRAPADKRDQIVFHPQVPHSSLLSRLVEHDMGFAGDIPHCENRDLTITNKILQYLLAGLAVVASDTRGHREVAQRATAAVSMFTAADPRSLAATLNALLSDPERLSRARADALEAAERHFCWERSAPVLLAQLPMLDAAQD
jgi:glycosyltransferase involved in cell wall biosynthesis